MRQFLLSTFILTSLCSLAQEERMTIEGKIVDANGDPVSDVYVINLVSNEKDITRENGIFILKIFPTDSLVISHISYFRKMVTAHSLLVNPLVTLESEHINIEEVTVSPGQKTDEDKARENIEQIDWDVRPQVGDGFSDADRVNQTMKENNRLLRTKAASVSLLKFSVGDMLAKWKKKRKQRKNRR